MVGPLVQTCTPTVPPSGRRIVITTFGSLGDLHPYLALARGLQTRGHTVVIATSHWYQERVEAEGVRFHAVRPAGPRLEADHESMRRIMDPKKGSEYIIREILMSSLRESYEDTLAAAAGADLLVSHVLTSATRLVAEKRNIPWASTYLQPLGFFSAYDPPVLPQVPFLSRLRFLGSIFHRPLFRLAKWSCRTWAEPWHRLRAEIGLAPTSENPLFEGLNSPSLILAMFSGLLAARQKDWPPQTDQCGFPFPATEGGGLPPEVIRFLDAGPPPVVLTLGSSGVLSAGTF
jgi:UDP:flavonoid glycosyltransferase YjiC (YdhE family)